MALDLKPDNMKHLVVVLSLLSCFLVGNAQNIVTEAEAVNASSKYMQRFFREKSFQAADVSHVSRLEREGKTLLYEVCFRNGCSALVSGVKSVMPVLAYNSSGDSVTFLQNSGGSGLSHFVGKYASAIGQILDSGSGDPDWRWKMLLEDTIVQMRGGEKYGPYITTRWKQTSSNDGQPNAYNYYVSSRCDRENRCAAGCVPVAMAQIMNYWKQPLRRPKKMELYDWNNMPDELRLCRMNGNKIDTNYNYEAERHAVARLLADCGSAANVIYCISECQSFAWPSDARNAFVSGFGYRSSAKLIRRALNEAEWKNSIMSDIMDGKPVFYAAVDEMMELEGHAFVCDGYDSETGMFHFNWGWGGAGSWVTLDSINSGSDDWNNLERAIVNIYPGSTQADVAFMRSGEALKVWPNPVSGILHIQLPDSAKGISQVTVRNLLGQVMLQTENLPSTGLDVSALPSGMYLLQLRTVDDALLSAKFVRE